VPSTPAVSTQTQLASLRGALEAARLREEKHKAEMERCTKELEALRWENMNSRRGEVEVGTWFYFSFLKKFPQMVATKLLDARRLLAI
jgi:hypothetical protein